ncbi:MAG: ADYC domain-containing protein [Polyangia bacterium]
MLSRSTSRSLGLLGVLALLGAGCAPATPESEGTQSVTQKGQVCTRGCGSTDEPNGRGIHIARTEPQSQYGMHNSDGSFKFWLTHFESSGGKVQAAGWFIDGSGTAVKALSTTIAASYQGRPAALLNMTSQGSQLVVTLRDTTGIVFTLLDKENVGLELNFSLANPDRRIAHDFQITVDSLDAISSLTGDVSGYTLRYADRSLGDKPRELCQNALTGPESNVFFGGASWHPIHSGRVDNPGHLTVTCQSGAVAVCMGWGYRPWAKAYNSLTSQDESLLDTHQACIQMKRAAYCGDAQAFTIEGTKIAIQDSFQPAFNSEFSGDIEAVWGPKGASCVTTPRHDPATYFASACAQTLPQCPAGAVGTLISSNP